MSDAAHGYKRNGQAPYETTPESPYPDKSARHADWAGQSLLEASMSDPRDHAPKVMAANTYALLSLRDKLDEFVSVMKDIRDVLHEQRVTTALDSDQPDT